MRLVVNGALGRMGRMVVEAAAARPGVTVVALIERPDHPQVGGLVPTPWGDQRLLCHPSEAGPADVGIDFSTPDAAVAFAEAMGKKGVAVLSGTTGMSPRHLEALRHVCATVPVLWTPNTSLGVFCLHELAALAAKVLGPAYDVEIIEVHHRHKRDAPSGTAISLARRIGDESSIVACRQGETGPRPVGEIGVLAVRGGEVVGEHTVLFLGDHDRLEITHRASSRMLFAQGAVALAERLLGLGPGWYEVKDLFLPPAGVQSP